MTPSPIHQRFRTEGLQIIRFGIVGMAATAVHIAVAFLTLSILGAPGSAVAGFLVANGVSYAGHRLWTFRGTQRAVVDGAWRHFLVSVVGLLVNLGTVVGLTAVDVPDRWAVTAGALVVPPLTYLAGRAWVFATPRRSPRPADPA